MMKWKKRLRVAAIVSQHPIGPTRPAVPMPAPAALLVIFSHIVETGPRIADVRVGASQLPLISLLAVHVSDREL